MNETYTDRFVQSTFYRYLASQRRDKLFLVSQYLLNRSFQICQPPPVRYCRTHDFDEIDSAAVFSFLFISQYVRRFLFMNCILRQSIADRNFITFSCYVILDKAFRIETYVSDFIFYFFYTCITTIYLHVVINHKLLSL